MRWLTVLWLIAGGLAMADLVAGNAPQWIPLDNRIGCIPASEITPAFTPFNWVEDQYYGKEMVNQYWRPIWGYHDWTLDESLEPGSQLFIHTAQDMVEMVPHFKHDGSGTDRDAAWYQLSTWASGWGVATSWVCFEDEEFVLFYSPSSVDGIIKPHMTVQPIWTDYTGNGDEYVYTYLLLEIYDEVYVALYYEYYDTDDVWVFTVDVDNWDDPLVYDPVTMKYFRIRHSVATNTFYAEYAPQKGGPWTLIVEAALPQVVPLWGYGIDWTSEIYWDYSPNTTRPSSSFFSFNPQAGAFQATLPLNVSVGDVPIPGGTDIQVDLTNEVGEM